MLLFNNPVLQRELIVNLRAHRSFLLLFVYQAALAIVVLIAYPQNLRLDLSTQPATAQKLVDFFFVGQFAIASLMAPSFTAGAITGEKERKTYEMLLASPLKPSVIVAGKLIAALTHLVVLIFSSLPIIMLCLPLGGVSIYELLAAYAGLISAIFLFGAISIFCSSSFSRTSSSLVVSYVFILPILIAGVLLWLVFAQQGDFRLMVATTIVPATSFVIGGAMLIVTAQRLLYPPDIGSQGNEVVDLEKEQREAVGLVIQRDQFPDNLFAPPRRTTLMADNANPIYDKEMHAELFSQGSLMLRLVIQISMTLAIPLMAVCLFLWAQFAAYYAGFVLTFNILVAPVFMAGAITSERERQTIDLLLTTTVTSWQILWGKLLAGYRVSFVLTSFLMFPMFLSVLPLAPLASNWLAMLGYFGVCIVASMFNAVLAMFISTIVRKTSTAMMLTYLILLGLYCLPVAIYFLLWSFASSDFDLSYYRYMGVTSPLMVVDSIPLTPLTHGALSVTASTTPSHNGTWYLMAIYVGLMLGLISILFFCNLLLFRARWRLTGRG